MTHTLHPEIESKIEDIRQEMVSYHQLTIGKDYFQEIVLQYLSPYLHMPQPIEDVPREITIQPAYSIDYANGYAQGLYQARKEYYEEIQKIKHPNALEDNEPLPEKESIPQGGGGCPPGSLVVYRGELKKSTLTKEEAQRARPTKKVVIHDTHDMPEQSTPKIEKIDAPSCPPGKRWDGRKFVDIEQSTPIEKIEYEDCFEPTTDTSPLNPIATTNNIITLIDRYNALIDYITKPELQSCIECGKPVPERETCRNCHGECRRQD